MMAEEKTYRGTYNPDKSRGEILKDRVSTREYFYDEDGKPFSGLKKAEQRAAELNNDPSSRTKNMAVKKAKGGMISSASKRADGCAVKGKTRGKMV